MSTNYDLSLIQGSSLSLALVALDTGGNILNLNGYSAQGYVRYRYSDTGILLNLSPTIHPSFSAGLINLNISDAQTSGLPVVQGVYDIKVTNVSGTIQVFNGYVNIYPQASY